eukprot:149584_1
MGNTQSKAIWRIYVGEMCTVSLFYGILYSLIIKTLVKKGFSPNDCLQLATNTGSTIHSVIMQIFMLFFFIEKKWKSSVISNPTSSGHTWVWWTSYMIIDCLLHIGFFNKYSKSIVPRRFDIVAHHFFFMLPLFLINFPDPYYWWPPLHFIALGEISNIFLNAQWFAKYFKKKKLSNQLKIAFMISWFVFRVPTVVFAYWWTIKKFQEIWKTTPIRVAICTLIILFGGSLPQIFWTRLIILKVYKSMFPNTTDESAIGTVHAHRVSLELADRCKKYYFRKKKY